MPFPPLSFSLSPFVGYQTGKKTGLDANGEAATGYGKI
jgi:hypothetical protein